MHTVDLPLHTGRAPRWLFNRMVKLSKTIMEFIMDEYGTEELLKRMADGYWFQAFSNVLGFDWHSSGSTTTTMGAVKVASSELEIGVAGGKGKVALKTPEQIVANGDRIGLSDKRINRLILSSKMSAKVDNSVVQDGYSLYHHTIIFDRHGNWTVVQQGMRDNWARRYHWHNADKFVLDPHSTVWSERVHTNVLNLTSKEHELVRKISVDLVKDNPTHIKLPKHHNIVITKRIKQTLKRLYEIQPKDYEDLISVRGVGPKTIRALALTSNLIYGAPLSWKDMTIYSFAHGGKDGVPYPVNRRVYDRTLRVLRQAIEQSKIGDYEKRKALKRLSNTASKIILRE
ncbi:DUF763 domain-containing protein [Nanoarchaeota archaeon]|nr:MAG: DUF763 domain-containing protein [Nanoarchaeota archaeon]